MCFRLFFFFLLLSEPLFAKIKPADVERAVTYPGAQTEKYLNDLARSDYHAYLAEYYKNREDAGFMALERFELALTRAIGDIRLAAYIKENKKRTKEALRIFHNWQAAFARAKVKNTLEKK